MNRELLDKSGETHIVVAKWRPHSVTSLSSAKVANSNRLICGRPLISDITRVYCGLLFETHEMGLFTS